MTATSPAATVAVGLVLLVVAFLIRERGWLFLIAGAGNGSLPFPEWTGAVVGTYTAAVGVGTTALGVLAWAGLTTPLLWQAFGAVVAVSSLTLPFWAPSYVRWRLVSSSNT